MKNEVAASILSVCRVLNKQSVQYLIVGGTAVAYHGYFRWSVDHKGMAAGKFDLDFWFNPSYQNYYRLLTALEEFGLNVERFKKEKTPDPKNSFFRFELENLTIDFLPYLIGLSNFTKSFTNKDTVSLQGVDIHFICMDDLLADKLAGKRPKDLQDIEELKKLNRRE